MGVLGSQWVQRRETQLLAQGTLLEAEPQFQKQTLTSTAAGWVSLVAVGQEQGRQMSLQTRGLCLRAPGGSRDSSCRQGFSWDSHCSRKKEFQGTAALSAAGRPINERMIKEKAAERCGGVIRELMKLLVMKSGWVGDWILQLFFV